MTPIKYSLNPADIAYLASMNNAFADRPYDSARADAMDRDVLLAERDAARQSSEMWAMKCADQAKELRRADRFRRATVAIGIGLSIALLALGLAALLRWV